MSKDNNKVTSPEPSSSDDDESSVASVHSDDSQLSFEFTGENCQKRIDEFVEVTATDSALAQFFLQDRKWNVLRSVNDYFKQLRKSAKEKGQREESVLSLKTSGKNDSSESKKQKLDTSNDEISIIEPCPSTSQHVSIPTQEIPKLFRHITWNIDGMNEKNLKLRAEAVCREILKEKASFVFLQEVTPGAEKIIRQNLSSKFVIFSGNVDSVMVDGIYYTLTLIYKEPFIKIENNSILNFKETRMGRNIIKTNVSFDDVKLCLLNTHLESTKEGESQRIQQLSYLLRHFKTVNPETTIIAGGDLNLRDKELVGIGGLPPDVNDAWVLTGSRKEVEFTWDMMRNDNLPYYEKGGKGFKPRMRFDRVFIRKTFPNRLGVVHFGLVGIERLKPYVCFPSDHWGVITSYQIYNK